MPPSYVKQPTDYVKNGALRAIEPAIAFLARNNVSPNTITTVGTLITVAASVVYATGHIMTAGWVLMGIILLLTVTAWITAVQRIAFVYRFTKSLDAKPIRMVNDPPSSNPAPPKAAGLPAARRAQS